MFGLFKSEDEKLFDSLKNQLNNLETIEIKVIQIAIANRLQSHYLNSLNIIKGKSFSESNSYFKEQTFYFHNKCNELHSNGISEEYDLCEFIESCILEGLYHCLYATSDNIILKASNYFTDFMNLKLIEKEFYLDEINEYNEIMNSRN
jgi:hypothetical protein